MIRRALLLGVEVLMLAGLLTGRRAAGVPTVHHQLTCSGSWYCEEHTADEWPAYAFGNRYGYEQQPDGSWKRFDIRQGSWASHMANECGAARREAAVASSPVEVERERSIAGTVGLGRNRQDPEGEAYTSR